MKLTHQMRLRWGWAKWIRDERRQLDANLDAAAIAVQSKAQELVGVGGGATGQRSGSTKAERAANRSAPWTPPHVDTGHLRRNIGWDRSGLFGFKRLVGTGIGGKESVGYAMWLEFGTRRMLPRPFLRRALWESRNEVERAIKRRKPHDGIAPGKSGTR